VPFGNGAISDPYTLVAGLPFKL